MRLTWNPAPGMGGATHDVVLAGGVPQDVYFFCPPSGCGFTASVFGDLRPVDGVPRFPRLVQPSA